MPVTADEILEAARAGLTSLTGETAGYLVLGVADRLASVGGRLRAETVLLAEDGNLSVASLGAGSAIDLEADLRALLGSLLDSVRQPVPALLRISRVSEGRGLSRLVSELEAGLIPVNRSAARRALSRLHRDVARAEAAGKLGRVVAPAPSSVVVETRTAAPIAPVVVAERTASPIVPVVVAERTASPIAPVVVAETRSASPIAPVVVAETRSASPIASVVVAQTRSASPIASVVVAQTRSASPIASDAAVDVDVESLPALDVMEILTEPDLPTVEPPASVLRRQTSRAMEVPLSPAPPPPPRIEPPTLTLHAVAAPAPRVFGSRPPPPLPGRIVLEGPEPEPTPIVVVEEPLVASAVEVVAVQPSVLLGAEPEAHDGGVYEPEATPFLGSWPGLSPAVTAVSTFQWPSPGDDDTEHVPAVAFDEDDDSDGDVFEVEPAHLERAPAEPVVEASAEPVVEASAEPVEPVPLDEPAPEPEVVAPAAIEAREASEPPPASAPRPSSYTPRRSDVSELLAGFGVADSRSLRDISRELKRIAEIDGTPCPPAVTASEPKKSAAR